MRGLLLKDMLNLRKSIWFILAIVAIWGVCGESFSIFAVFYFSYAVISSTASADEKCGWNKLETSLPFTRRELVEERYVLGAISLGIGAVCIAIVRLAAAAFRGGAETLSGIIPILYCGTSIGFLLNAILLPLQMKYGYTKSRVVALFVYGAITVICFTFVSFVSNKGIAFAVQTEIFLPAMLIVFAFLDYLSFLVSVKIYEKREF